MVFNIKKYAFFDTKSVNLFVITVLEIDNLVYQCQVLFYIYIVNTYKIFIATSLVYLINISYAFEQMK